MPNAECNPISEVEGPTPSPGKERLERAEIAFLVAMTAAAFLVRLWPVWQVHFWDEAVYLQNAEVICCGKLNYSELSSRPPLLSLLFAGVFRLWHSVYAASILVALLNALGPLFLYLGGRRLVGRVGAGIAALLLAFSPFFVAGDTGNSLLTDSPALTLVLVSLWLVLAAVEHPSVVGFVAAGLVSSLAVLMRFASLPTIALLSLLLLRADRWFRAALQFGAGFAIGICPYLLWSRIRYGGFLATLQRGWANVAGSTEPAAYYVRNFDKVFPWITAAGLVLWLAGRIVGKLKWKRGMAIISPDPEERKNPRWSGAFLWLWALVLLAYFSALTHKELRYIIPLAPPLFLLAGDGLKMLLPKTDLRVRAVGALVLAAALAYSFAPILGRFRGPFVSPFISEEKEVADFLDSKAPKGSALYTGFNYPVFGYYTHLPTHVLLPGDFYKSFPHNMPADGYLIVYKQMDTEPNLDWVDSNPHFQRYQEFPSLVVFEYRTSRN